MAFKSHFHVYNAGSYSPLPQLTLSGSNTSNDIIRNAFGNCHNGLFQQRLIDGAMFDTSWTFRELFSQPHNELFRGILDAILYRALATYGYGRMDDPWIHKSIPDHLKGGQSSKDLYISSASKVFLKLQYLPYVFADPRSSAFRLCQEVMEKLKDRGEYKGYVDGLMNGPNPKKWEFAAFHGIEKSTGPYIRGLKDFDKITFDHHHPLIHAIQNGHLSIVKHLTGQGKLPYWKVKAGSTSADRPVLGVLGKCSSLEMVKFLVENDPNLLSEVADHPKQYFLKYAKTPEIFAYLQEKLGLDTHALYSFANIYGGEQNVSILDVMMMEGSVEQREHIVSIFPDIPVTDVTFQEIRFGFSPKVLDTFIRNFKGDWDALTICGLPALEYFLQFSHTPLQITDRILPKLNKHTLVKRHGENPLGNGRSPYVLVAEHAHSPAHLRDIWMLTRHQFPWPAHIPLTQYSNINQAIKAIRWLFKQQNPGEVPPTLDAVNELESKIVPDASDPMHAILKADFDARRAAFSNFLDYRELLDGLSSAS